MRHLKLYEQLNEWDPFGEEMKEDDMIKVGDRVRVLFGYNLGHFGKIHKIYNSWSPGASDHAQYNVEFKNNSNSTYYKLYKKNQIEKVDPWWGDFELNKLPFDDYELPDFF